MSNSTITTALPRSLRSPLCRLLTRLRTGPNLESNSGITELLEVVVLFPVMGLLLFTMVYFSRAWYVRAAIEDAAAAGARWAPTSLSGAQGCAQARRAMTTVLSKYHLDAAGATFSVAPASGSGSSWGRFSKAVVSVRYKLDQSTIAIAGPRWGNPTISTRLVVPVDTFNNRYANGWQVCN